MSPAAQAEGSPYLGPFAADYGRPHCYARDVASGAGNCVCGSSLGDALHTEAAPGVPVPVAVRKAAAPAGAPGVDVAKALVRKQEYAAAASPADQNTLALEMNQAAIAAYAAIRSHRSGQAPRR